jgi:hypothetical protein
MDGLSKSPLERQVIKVLRENPENCKSTQRHRSDHVKEAVRVVEQKFGLQKLANLGAKHVAHIVETWKAQHESKRSLDNKLSNLRWLVQKIGKANLMPRSNRELGIEPAPRHTRAGRFVSEEKWQEHLNSVQHPVVRAQFLLGRHFGMRFEETALFRPHVDVQQDRIVIVRGTKGGKKRYVMIRTPEQVSAIAVAKAAASGERGLIPERFPTLAKYANWFYGQLRAIGIGQEFGTVFHDYRRTYIGERVLRLVKHEGHSVEDAVHLVTREVGHNRAEVMQWYIDFEAEFGAELAS